MAVTIQLPVNVEEALRRSLPDFDAAAKELLLVSLYREHQLTLHELATALATSRYEAEGVLKRHSVTEDLLTSDEFDEERGIVARASREP